ncbi:MAG: radical SAM protein [Nitrospirae bacterium]|nr:radical SAM protein [Nitrospirota bacterium]
MIVEKEYLPRLVFWETTKGCNLRCIHCRATALDHMSPDDLSTREGFDLLDQIRSFSRPIIVLSGGEPLYRKDIFDIASYGTEKGLRMVLATNGTMVTKEIAKKIVDSGIKRVSISIDGGKAGTHDDFRKIPGSFDEAMRGFSNLKELGMSLQINTTIAKHNYKELPEILDLALRLGVDALHTFLLVPVGCGVDIAEDQMVPADEYEAILNWFYDRSKDVMIDLKATCAPHYFRVRAQRILEEKKGGIKPQPFVAPGTRLKAGHVDTITCEGIMGDGKAHNASGLSAMTKGCLAGTGICFISNKGDVYPCGYLPVTAGNVRTTPFEAIWRDSKLFANLRDPGLLTGKCGICEYKHICEGCRARAYAVTGDYLSEEPFCSFEPKGQAALHEVHQLHQEAEEELPGLRMTWSDEAKTQLKKVPFFVRKKVAGRIEEFASSNHIDVIDPDVMSRARAVGERG